MGGRMPLSSQMSSLLRRKFREASMDSETEPELKMLGPLFELQRRRSHIPADDELLIEVFKTREGHHACFYPFEGRNIHEALASLIAWRISLLRPFSFTIAYNDYGFELLSDTEIPIAEMLDNDMFTTTDLSDDLMSSMNATEMARRKFRDIAVIAGLVFQGYPGRQIKTKHLQSSSGLFFDVFRDHESDNLLFKQAYSEILDHQIEFARLHETLRRIAGQRVILKYPDKPTPLAFPIMVDRLREKLSSEKLEDRIRKMTIQFEK
jgi:ATP-dependent helicase Lhr and Lhr-like helicase